LARRFRLALTDRFIDSPLTRVQVDERPFGFTAQLELFRIGGSGDRRQMPLLYQVVP